MTTVISDLDLPLMDILAKPISKTIDSYLVFALLSVFVNGRWQKIG